MPKKSKKKDSGKQLHLRVTNPGEGFLSHIACHNQVRYRVTQSTDDIGTVDCQECLQSKSVVTPHPRNPSVNLWECGHRSH